MDKIIVAASTHWDREWYRTFQDFQIRLCDLINQLLDLLEKDEEFLCYTFDGQCVVLEDYLEIYPENEGRIRHLVREGKLVFGPLYNLPDEFLSSGEALIRNFLIGDEVCKNIGGKMNAGYVPDNFGHISQLPQILNGVGIDTVFFFRGTNIDKLTTKEFIWSSPNGSKVLGEYMLLGYWSLKSWGKLNQNTTEHFIDAYKELKKCSKLNTFLLINGSDHLYQDPDFTTMLNEVKEEFKEFDIVNGSIEDYARIAKKAAAQKDLPEIYGELRDFRYGPDPTSVTSCRSYLKRLMFHTLAEAERYAEPLSAIAYSMGEMYPKGFFRKAWKQILISLGHDAISGCSVDEVMKDVETYIVHAKQTLERISELAMEKLSKGLDTAKLKEDEQYLAVFNPHPFEYDCMTEQVIHIEGSVSYKDFQILDMDRTIISYELLDVWDDVITREFPYHSKEKIYRSCFKVLFKAASIPALGMKPYIIRKSTVLEKRENELYIRLQNSNSYIENEFYRIEVNSDASIKVLDKKSKKVYDHLNTYISRGEAGDEYQHVSPLFDSHVFARLKNLSVVSNSFLSNKLCILAEIMIPVKSDANMPGRGKKYEECQINTEVILYEDTKRIEFRVEINNPCSDHILYAKFPTNFKNSVDYSYVSFDEVKRDNYIYNFDPNLRSTQSILKPMQKYGGIKGEDGSLHLLGKGIYEYHTKEQKDGVDFYMTLLRSTSYMFRGLPISWMDGQHSTTPIVETEGSREIRKLEIAYALYLNEDMIAREAEQYEYPLRTIDVYKNDKIKGSYDEFSFLKIDSEDVILSALKKYEHGEGIILRVYNLKDEEVKTNIHTMLQIEDCQYCNLLEEPYKQVEFQNNEIAIYLKAKEIITLLIKFGENNE